MPENTTQPTENQPNQELSAVEIQAARIASLKTLPNFLFCPDCGALHFGNDMSYNADLSGRSYGNAWMGNDYVETESNEEDTDYENIRYTCDHDEYDLTDELNTTIQYLNKIASFAAQLNIDMRVIDRVIDVINRRNNSNYWIRTVDNRRFILRYTKVINGDEVSYDIINPLILNIAQDMAVEAEYEFNYNHIVYEEATNNINEVLRQLAEAEAAAAAIPVQETPTARPVLRTGFVYDSPESFTFAAAAAAMQTRSHQRVEEGDRDPFNSNVFEPNHHQRWRDTDTTAICTCEHCAYSFECSSDIDLVTCPKCNKETTNV